MRVSNTAALRTNAITRYFRMGRILAHTLLGLLIATALFPFAGQAFKARLIQWWSRHLLAAINLRVASYGHIPATTSPLSNTMFVANHISWADIHALNSLVALRFIAKSEIKNWPIFGYLVSKANTLFIDRNRRQDAKRSIEIAKKSLQAGDNLCLFPEGTTTDGTEIKLFKSSLIQAAILAGATVWPVAIRYPYADGSANTEVAYTGNITLAESVQQILLQKQPTVELHFLDPIPPEEYAAMDRRELTLHIEGLIRNKLAL